MKTDRVTYKENDKDVTIVVRVPNHTQLTDANLYSAAIFNKAMSAGACLRNQVDDLLEAKGVWTKEYRESIGKIEDELTEKLTCLETGKIEIKGEDGEVKEEKPLKLSEARSIALDARILRWKLNILGMQRRTYDEYTIEGQSENARFNYLCSVCMMDEEGNRLFKSVDDYHEHSEKTHIIEAAGKLANLIFGTEEFQRNLPENQFLIKHKLVDEVGHLVNKSGQRIDFDGNVIEEAKVEEAVEPIFEDDLS